MNVNEANRDDSKIDTEIEEIEMEINRLASKLEALRLEKAEQNLKTTEKAEQNLKTTEKEKIQKKIGGNLAANPNSKIQRRGVSLGPTEIIASVRSRPPMKPEITPIKSTQSRRKSCFFKLQEINEEKVTKERGGRSLSLSPTSRRSVSKTQSSRQGFTTVGSKKSVKKDEGVLSSIQPKKLFKDGEKSVGAKKPINKNGRVVASRYNQIPSQSTGIQKQTDHRKRSFPENDRKTASLVGKSPGFPQECGRSNVTEGRVKKRWEIPSNVLVDSPSMSISKMADLLPKIKTIRCTEEYSPRDSGPAKRAAELIAKKSYFGAESIELENSVCQALDFEEE
ncbi:hypothetical protein BVC80_1367g56 [Macleaya cordata]|uniref:Uncharacterized protein n=1 Tax=Macleaya cordata TaxID=56857 RepID=A0A200QVF2_MACCD|nr:hypothetical protein BVC80_1367g56 [Macleaya cordata]